MGLQQHESLSLAQALPGLRTSSLPFLPAHPSPAGEGPRLLRWIILKQ